MPPLVGAFFFSLTLSATVETMDAFPPTARTTLRRLPQRGVYDKAAVYAILDEGFICHVGFAIDGQPYVIPTGYARSGDQIFFHGSAASRMMHALSGGLDVCVTVTLVDGFVLSRSAFHHSINYRSVVMLGRASVLADPAGRWPPCVASPTTSSPAVGTKCARPRTRN